VPIERQITTLIADDEPLARRRLGALLRATPWISLVDEVGDGASAARAIDELQPELVFLDVVMPGLTGLQVVERIAHRPTIVFTTAYDRFAVAAFEAQALDYLLKPFGRRRLLGTLERIRGAVVARPLPSGSLSTTQVPVAQAGAPLEWLFVRERGRVTPVCVGSVVRFEGSDDYVTVHTAERRLLATLRMGELERALPAGFVRIHRSHIVNLAMVERFAAEPNAKFTVVLRDGTRLPASRECARWLRGHTI
jgi:two-component system LytT family response regulator